MERTLAVRFTVRDADKARAELRKVGEGFQATSRDLNKSAKAAQSEIRKLGRQARKSGEEIDSQTEATRAANAALGSLQRAEQQASENAQKLNAATADLVQRQRRGEITADQLRSSVRSLERVYGETSQSARLLGRNVRTLNDRMSGAMRSVANLRGALGALAGVLSVREMVRFGEEALSAAESIADVSKQAGISAERLQGLRVAFDQNGGSADELDQALLRFNRRVGLAAEGSGAASDAVERMDISLRDASGAMRSNEDVLNEVVGRIANLESASERAALASEFFGDRVGPKLAPLLAQGREGIAQYTEQLRDAGVLFSDEIVDKAGSASAELRRVGDQVGDAFQIGLLQEFVGEAGNVKDALADIRPVARDLGESVGGALDDIAGAAKSAADNVSSLDEAFAALIGARIGAKLAGGPGAVIGTIVGLLANSAVQAATAEDAIRNVTRETGALVSQRDRLVSQADDLREAGGFVPPDLIQRIAGLNARLAESGQAARVARDGLGGAAESAAGIPPLFEAAARATDLFASSAETAGDEIKALGEDASDGATGVLELIGRVGDLDEQLSAVRGGGRDALIEVEAAQEARDLIGGIADDELPALRAALDDAGASGGTLTERVADLIEREESLDSAVSDASEGLSAQSEATTQLAEDVADLDARIRDATRTIEDEIDAAERQAEQRRILARVTREEGADAARQLEARLRILNESQDRGIDLTTDLGQAWLEARRSALRAGEGLDDARASIADAGSAAGDAGDDLDDFSESGERATGIVAGAFENLGVRITDALEGALFRGEGLLDSFASIARRSIASIGTELLVDAGGSVVNTVSAAAQPGSGGLDLASLGRSAGNLIDPGNISADAVAQGAANFAPSVFSTGAVEAGSGAVAANTAAQTLGTAANFAPTALTAANIGRTFASGDIETGVQQTAGAIGGFAFGGPTGSAIGATLLPAISNLTDALGPFEALINPVGFVSGLFGGGSGADDSDLDTRVGRRGLDPGRGTNLPGNFANVFVDADNNFTTEGANQVEDAISNFIGPQLEAINDSIFEITGQTINDFASGTRKTGDFKRDFLGGDDDFRDVINLVLQDTIDVVADSAGRAANDALRNGDLIASTLDVVSQDRELAGAFAGQLAQINQTGNLGEIERVFTAISNIEPSDPQQLRQVINFATTFDDQLSALGDGVQNFSESIRGGVVQNLNAIAQQLNAFENMTARAFGADAPEVDQAREAGADFLRRLVGIRETEAESVTQTTAEIQRLDALLQESVPVLERYNISLDAATQAIRDQQAEVLGLREAGLQLEAAGLSQTGNSLVQVAQGLETLRTDAEAVGLSAEATADIIDGRFNAALSGVSQEQIPELISVFEGLEGTIPGLDTVLAELEERVGGAAGAIGDAASLTAREGAQIRGDFEAIFGPQGIQGQLQSLGIAGTELGNALSEVADAGIRPGTQAAEDFGERLIDLANGDLDLATSALRIFGNQVAETGRQAQEAASIESSRQETLGNRPLVELSPSELLSERSVQLPQNPETLVGRSDLDNSELRDAFRSALDTFLEENNSASGEISFGAASAPISILDPSAANGLSASQIREFLDTTSDQFAEVFRDALPTEGGGLTGAAQEFQSVLDTLQGFAEDREGVPEETVNRAFDAIGALNERNSDFDESAASSLVRALVDAAEPQQSESGPSSNTSSAPTGPSDEQLLARLQVRNPDFFPGEPTLDTRIQARGLGGMDVADVLQGADLGNLDLSGAQDLAAEIADVANNGSNAAEAIGILNAVLNEQTEVTEEAAQAERERTAEIERQREALERAGRGVADTIEGFLVESQASPLTRPQRLAEAESQFAATLAQAQGASGDERIRATEALSGDFTRLADAAENVFQGGASQVSLIQDAISQLQSLPQVPTLEEATLSRLGEVAANTERTADRLFQELDTNDDGVISAQELANARLSGIATDADRGADEGRRTADRLFQELDTNDDGVISAQELANARLSGIATDADRGADEGRRAADRLFQELDTNDDGVISRQELANAELSRIESDADRGADEGKRAADRLFQRLDVDDDGALSPGEFRAGVGDITQELGGLSSTDNAALRDIADRVSSIKSNVDGIEVLLTIIETYTMRTARDADDIKFNTNGILNRIAGIKGNTDGVETILAQIRDNTSNISGAATGGFVQGVGGPTQDNQFRALSVGEAIIPAAQAGQYRSELEDLIAGGNPFETGLAVAPAPVPVPIAPAATPGAGGGDEAAIARKLDAVVSRLDRLTRSVDGGAEATVETTADSGAGLRKEVRALRQDVARASRPAPVSDRVRQ